ncbi:MAG TPA: hypothetical protein VKC66_16965 [Xanthobacteraceae bacterium]|nr:hypothetical protein [Xanthobacteraceae bacterium]
MALMLNRRALIGPSATLRRAGEPSHIIAFLGCGEAVRDAALAMMGG